LYIPINNPQSAINNHQGGDPDISLFQEKSLGPEVNLRKI
jgi:hypothetical protein